MTRAWLAGALLLAAACSRSTPPAPLPASPLAEELTPRAASARARLEAVVRAEAVDLDQPWALAHALLALGPDLRVGDGPAIEALVDRWARPSFPAAAGEVRVEPHPDLVLKTLVEIGASPDRAPVRRLYDAAAARAWAADDRPAATWDDSAWTLQALATWTPPHAARLDAAARGGAARLAVDLEPLAAARDGARPLVKERQGIFGYACGGAHFVAAVATLVGLGHGDAADRASVEASARLHLWRLDAELALTDAAIESNPDWRLLLVVQRLKLLGHWLEVTHRLASLGLLAPDEQARAATRRAVEELARTVEALDAVGAWSDLAAIRAEREQTWLDLVGDGAHALHALELGDPGWRAGEVGR